MLVLGKVCLIFKFQYNYVLNLNLFGPCIIFSHVLKCFPFFTKFETESKS